MTLRVGMIGAGAIAHDHCKNINAHPEAKVVAVADISKERREEVKKAYGMERAYEKWEDLAKDPAIDAVAIALPNSLHAPASIAALGSGKHVLLDKPFAMNLAEARNVANAAKRSKKVLMVGMNQRYRKDAQVLRTIVERGELGEIYHAKTHWCRRMGSPRFGTWFVSKKMAGGGCLLDIGVHFLDLSLYLIDNWEPVSVYGQVYSKLGPRGIGEGGWGKSDRNRKIAFDVDDFATALIKFKNGSTLELNISWILHQETPDSSNVKLYGTEGGASLSPTRICRLSRRPGEYEVVEPQNVNIEHKVTNRQANWIDAILGKDTPLCTIPQALTVQKILDAIYASSDSGREIRLK